MSASIRIRLRMEAASMKCDSLPATISIAVILCSGAFAAGGVVPLSRTSTLRIAGVAGTDSFNTVRSTEGLIDTNDALSAVALDTNGTTGRASAAHESNFQGSSSGDHLSAAARGGANVF